jgi:hypothetical protein
MGGRASRERFARVFLTTACGTLALPFSAQALGVSGFSQYAGRLVWFPRSLECLAIGLR